MKKEFRRRLENLRSAIERALDNDTINGNLFPALFAVFSYMYCKSSKDLTNKYKRK